MLTWVIMRIQINYERIDRKEVVGTTLEQTQKKLNKISLKKR